MNIHTLAQSTFIETRHYVYDFLINQSTRGFISLSDYSKYLTRYEIKKYLIEAQLQKDKLSETENELLEELLFEFGLDSTKISYVHGNIVNGITDFFTSNKVRFLQYNSEKFQIEFTPRIKYEVQSVKDEMQTGYSWGFGFWGAAGSNFGFRADFLENGYGGKYHDIKNIFSNSTGRIISRRIYNSFEFSDVNASFIYSDDEITIGLVKEKITFGEGFRSQLVLSEKAPSFPAIYLAYKPTDWLKFYYMHGWLISKVVDSVRSYYTQFLGNLRTVELEKYFVMHALQLMPTENLSFTFGETMIYSDRSVFPGYLIPFIFFRPLDHIFALGSGESGNNGSLFGEVVYSPANKVKLYGSIFIDEFALSQAFKGDLNRNQSGFTIGAHTYALPVEDISLRVEYTKILPWVYSNWIPSQTYRHSDFLLGHYIGQNSDQIFFELKYYCNRDLRTTIWGEQIRNGGISAIENQYTTPGESFLYGLRREEKSFGFSVDYKFNYNFNFKLEYKHSNITDEDKLRTPAWQLGSVGQLIFVASFGL